MHEDRERRLFIASTVPLLSSAVLKKQASCDFGAINTNRKWFNGTILVAAFQNHASQTLRDYFTIIKMSGVNNPEFNEEASNFCILLSHASPMAYDIFKRNVVGYSHRHVKRLNARMRIDNIFTVIDDGEVIAKRLTGMILKRSDEDGPVEPFSIGIDGTKVT